MRTAVRPRYEAAEGADQAFWISFADLMTALMVLFLMVMAVALLSITRSAASSAATPAEAVAAAAAASAASASSAAVAATAASAPPPAGNTAEAQAIRLLLQQLAQAAAATPGVHLDMHRHVIDFGDRARFPTGSHRLDTDSARLLRQFVPQLLAVTDSELGRRWVSRVVVEGFADARGDYLFNLNLSLQRAQRVMCTLLDAPDDGSALTEPQRASASELFAVGGFSFNEQRASLDASRRIELRIEFGPRPAAQISGLAGRATGFGACRLPV